MDVALPVMLGLFWIRKKGACFFWRRLSCTFSSYDAIGSGASFHPVNEHSEPIDLRNARIAATVETPWNHGKPGVIHGFWIHVQHLLVVINGRLGRKSGIRPTIQERSIRFSRYLKRLETTQFDRIASWCWLLRGGFFRGGIRCSVACIKYVYLQGILLLREMRATASGKGTTQRDTLSQWPSGCDSLLHAVQFTRTKTG